MTQTTVDRLRDTLLPIEFDDLGKIDRALEQFAAEIDRLTAERDEARKYGADVRAESLSRFDEMTRRNNRILALEKELAEARADLAKCGADLQYEFDNPGDSRRRIAELEAEAERLRPAAEAWETYERLREYPMPPKNAEGEQVDVWHLGASAVQAKFESAAARARAAKEPQP